MLTDTISPQGLFWKPWYKLSIFKIHKSIVFLKNPGMGRSSCYSHSAAEFLGLTFPPVTSAAISWKHRARQGPRGSSAYESSSWEWGQFKHKDGLQLVPWWITFWNRYGCKRSTLHDKCLKQLNCHFSFCSTLRSHPYSEYSKIFCTKRPFTKALYVTQSQNGLCPWLQFFFT